MFILDRVIVGGISFVLDKIARAADTELSDVDRLRERLLEAQMRYELGEIGADELAEVEAEVLPLLRESRPAAGSPSGRISGVEVSIEGEAEG